MRTDLKNKGVNMKNIAGKIAMILILVMIAGSFTDCLSYVYRNDPTLNRVIYGVVDLVFLPISVIALIVYLVITQETEAQSYLVNLDNNLMMDQYSLLSNYYKMNSLPPEEFASLMQILNSIPQTECNSTMEKFTSFSGEQLVQLVKTYNSLPESAVISSIERMKSLPESEIFTILRDFNSLTETELNSVIESINSQFEIEKSALADNFASLPETGFIYAVEAKSETVVSVL
jgi:hypothetical protein